MSGVITSMSLALRKAVVFPSAETAFSQEVSPDSSQDYSACWMGNRFSQPLTQSLVKVLEIFQETFPFTYWR